MSFSPIAVLKTTKPLDGSLCIICQTAKSEKLIEQPGKVENIIKSAIEHERLKTGKYIELAKKIKCTDQKTLDAISYHKSCYKKFTTDEIIIKRALGKVNTKETPQPSRKIPRLSRSSVQPFDYQKCLFCQSDESIEHLHECMAEARDVTLKQAFLDCPESLAVYKIRYERALDARAGDIKYHTSCWVEHIDRRIKDFQKINDNVIPLIVTENNIMEVEQSVEDENKGDKLLSNKDKTIKALVMQEIIAGVEIALENNEILSIRDVINTYKMKVLEEGGEDDRVYSSIRKWMKKCLLKHIPDIKFVDSINKSEPQTITTSNMDSLLIHLAIQRANQDVETEIGILESAAVILRKRSVEFLKDRKTCFDGSIKNTAHDTPPSLKGFFKWVLAGKRDIHQHLDVQVDCQASIIAQQVLFSIKTDKQSYYFPINTDEFRTRKRYQPTHHIGVGLALRKCDRNNQMINLLSAPNFNLSIDSRSCLLWETRIANAVIDNMKQNNDVYVPLNMSKDILPLFHLDNIDFIEDTPDGKNTTHALQLSVFQSSNGTNCNTMSLHLDLSDTKELTLKPNVCNRIIKCNKPGKNNYTRTDGCSNFINNISKIPSPSMFKWLHLKLIEIAFGNQLSIIEGDQEREHTTEPPVKISKSTINDQPIQDNISSYPEFNQNTSPKLFLEDSNASLKELKIPSFSATNSILRNDINMTETRIFKTPLIPGPASDYSAIYTALMHAQGISVWTCGATSKSVISLDLDLYEKCYLLVNSRQDMKDKFILCLGELHAVFAHIRAIGNFIRSSGIEDAWLEAGWYDSECVIRQILDCKHMKRAIEAHEATYLAFNYILLHSIVTRYSQEFAQISTDLFTLTKMARKNIEDDNFNLGNTMERLMLELSKIDFLQKYSQFDVDKQSNFTYRFLMVYIRMVQRLFTFIEASRARDWLLHLSAAEDLMQDFTSMNRIKYRRMFAAYIADMTYLQTSDPDIWEHFLSGEFSVQKTQTAFTAIGRDHAGEQVNRELKTRGGITGITRNENSRTRQILIAPILADISNQMMNRGNAANFSSTKHHQFTKAFTERQNKKVISLLEVLNTHDVNFNADQCLIRNLVTGQVFPENVCNDVINCENTGIRLYKEFVIERLQPNSTVSLFAPLKKVVAKSLSSCNAKKTIKVKDKIVELGQNCNLFAKCSILAQKRDIDMEEIVGNHELSTVPRSLMNPDGSLLHGGDGKSLLIKTLKAESGTNTQPLDIDFDCIAIDAMCLLNQITKPTWVKTGSDLGSCFCKRVDEISMGAATVIVAFDTYNDLSLKNITRAKRQAKKVSRHYDISSSTNISKLSMKDLLSHNHTKQALAKFLLEFLIDYLKSKSKSYIIAGNSKTFSSFNEPSENNHEEGDTLIIHLLSLIPVLKQKTIVYATDTDIFVLLMRFRSNVPSRQLLFQNSSNECIDIDKIHNLLGEQKAKALLSLHGITGCDTSSKFNHKSKEHWVKLFLKNSDDSEIINAFLEFEHTFKVCNVLEKFICKGYLRGKEDAVTLNKTRWILFKRSAAESQKLPPTRGAFEKHLRRSFIQINIWANAYKATIPYLDPHEYGWKRDGNSFFPETTDDDIAPCSVINLVSCQCKLKCNKRCGCFINGLVCTDFCNCSDFCENTDPQLSLVDPDEYDLDDLIL